MSFLGSGKGTFDKLLDSATSQILLEPNWAINLEICDSIRQNDVTPKYAVTAIRKKIKDPNPHVAKFGLVVLETCVKNCGQSFHEEIATHDFMDDLRTLAQNGSAPVKEQILLMLQAWNHAFRSKTQFQPILATYNLMKMEGYQFPPLNESDAMFSADVAPAWKDGDTCHMCRVKFSTFTRQHHCRACGEVFCSKCSSKQSIIPRLGIEREVRVCDHCYNEISPSDDKSEVTGAAKQENEGELPLEYLNSDLAKESQIKPKISEAEAKAHEEEEMQLALALSLSEEEASKSTTKNWSAPSSEKKLYEPLKPSLKSVEPKKEKTTAFSNVTKSLRNIDQEDSSELSKYLDRSYWEKKSAENKTREPSAPLHSEEIQYADEAVNNDSDEEERLIDSSAFITTMEKSIEMFVDRMNSVRLKGKHIAMDSSVQSLFQSLSAMHPQLMNLIEDEEESKAKYEAMLQKLAIIREARESLNDMRAQHQEKVSQQELEQEMLRRMQMEQKLELMRQQKQEYLEYQRQLQIQRQQELEIYQQDKLRQKQVQNLAGGNFPDPQMNTPYYQYANQNIPTSAYIAMGQGGPPGYEIPNQQYASLSSADPSVQPYSVQTSGFQQQQQQQQQLQQQQQQTRDYYPGLDQQLPNQQQILSKQVFPNQHPAAQQPQLPQQQLSQQQLPQQQIPPQQLPPQQLPPQQLPPQQLPQQQLPQQQLPPQQLPQQQLPPQQLPKQQVPVQHQVSPQIQQQQPQQMYPHNQHHQTHMLAPQQQQVQQGPQMSYHQSQLPPGQQQVAPLQQQQQQQQSPQVPQHQQQQVPVPMQDQNPNSQQHHFNMHQYPSQQPTSAPNQPHTAQPQLYPDGQQQYNAAYSQPYPSQQEQQQIYSQPRGYAGETYQQQQVYQQQQQQQQQQHYMPQAQNNLPPVQELSANMKDLQLISFD